METFDELDRVLGTVTFDDERLIARAVEAGRRRQRRRRVGACVGVVALGALATTPMFLSPSDSRTGGPVDHPTHSGLSRPAQIDARLAAALPGPSRQGFMAPGREGNDIQVERTLDPDGLGRGDVSLSVQTGREMKPLAIANTDAKCLQLGASPPGDGCQRVPGGWVFTSFVPRPSSTKDVEWTANLVLENGSSVALVASNHVHLGVPPSRTTPVLDADQMVNLVTDPIWFDPASKPTS
jgi:hypothetical protein